MEIRTAAIAGPDFDSRASSSAPSNASVNPFDSCSRRFCRCATTPGFSSERPIACSAIMCPHRLINRRPNSKDW